ncbi:hypothetical protein ACWGNA_08880 [Brucella cytisi]|uniref:hypothetical protein n=1 Tax=Brucella cytisi TaxID=407152 RepID=UPI0035E2812A
MKPTGGICKKISSIAFGKLGLFDMLSLLRQKRGFPNFHYGSNIYDYTSLINIGTIVASLEFVSGNKSMTNIEEREMGELLFWIVLIGLPVLLISGFAYAHYLKRTGGTSAGEDRT